MASPGHGKAYCASTGIAVPECSCRSCLEEMLERFRPELMPGEIRVARAGARTSAARMRRRQPG